MWVEYIGFIAPGAWAPHRVSPRRRRRLPETPGTVEGYCDREPVPGLVAVAAIGEWGEDDWFGRARMAQARRAAVTR